MLSPTVYQGASVLQHLGVIRARGADAASFLQGQLTNDVITLGPERARLAGFCSAKGRLQASFWVVRPMPDELLLICSADLLAPTLKRLSMFVLRAKCKLDDASAELPLLGVVGSADGTGLVTSLLPSSGAPCRVRWHSRRASAACTASVIRSAASIRVCITERSTRVSPDHSFERINALPQWK